ncbi:hypothetical protein RIF29_37120 [Crotalaria pallida]|uniref:Uncharacterized protein n=1 Tax=Crotalaria pallida TaxID=3830 RepID=A0AAN9EHB9_CROPI
MGACASSHHSPTVTRTTSTTTSKTTTTTTNVKRGAARGVESFRRPTTIVVIDMKGGGIKEYNYPIPASHVVKDNPNCFICNSESLYIGTCMPRVPDEEELQPGRIYFLVPLSQSHYPLSLTLLCDLAVKASYALANNINNNNNTGSKNAPHLQRRRSI